MRDDPPLAREGNDPSFHWRAAGSPTEGYEKSGPAVVARRVTVSLHPSAFILQARPGGHTARLACYYGGPGTFFPFVHIVIEISERIEVAAAPGAVWNVLSDPRAVVDCVPGAELGEQQEDGSYNATLTVKFGPAKVAFRTKVALELDPTAMSGRVSSRGRDNQGGTRVQTSMTFKVVEGAAPGTAAVPVDAQVEISGKLASLVESGASLVVKHMTKEFSERLAAKLSAAGKAQGGGVADERR